jgi:hypothetical protein
MRHALTTALLLPLLLASTWCQAARFDPATVSSRAQWVAHVNFDRFNETTVSERLFRQVAEGPHAVKYDAFKTIFRIDPQRDFHGLTAYGTSDDERDAILVLRATHDRATIEALLQAGENYRSESHGGQRLHRFENEKSLKGGGTRKEVGWVAFQDEHTLVYGKTPERLKAALAVMGDRSGSLAGDDRGLVVPGDPSFFAATVDVAKLQPGDPGQAAFLENAKSVALLVDEQGSDLVFSMAITAASAETANEIVDALNGLVAITRLGANNDPGKAWLLEFLEKLGVTRNGSTVLLSLEVPVAKAMEQLRRSGAFKPTP